MVAPLVMLAIKEAPGVIRLLREAFAKHHPDEPQPTDEEVIAAFDAAFKSSLAMDEMWLRMHPRR
jgi:hypothetical protein